MRGLRRLRARVPRGAPGERGGVAVIVATLLSGGVVMGMLAVSIDLGNLMSERRQLQNGADSTSLALARECAADATQCEADRVESLLGANARDDAAQWDDRPSAPSGACARGTTDQVGALSAALCPSSSGGGDIADLGECPPLPEWLRDASDIPYVETYAATETATGDDELFLPFSRVLAGGESGDKGTSACARAAWGKPVGYSASLPLTFSSCEWNKQTSGGTDYVENGPVGAKPGYGPSNPWPHPSREVVIQLHDPGDEASDCSWNGKDTAGGFGWLDNSSSGDCEAEVSDDDWAQIEPGAGLPNACKTKLPTLHQTVIDIPVFDCIVADKSLAVGDPPSTPADVCDPSKKLSSGKNTWYHLAGWAKFYVSGYGLPGADSGGSSMPGGYTCSGSEKCITGWFLTGALSGAPDIAPPGGGNDFGTYVVKPAG